MDDRHLQVACGWKIGVLMAEEGGFKGPASELARTVDRFSRFVPGWGTSVAQAVFVKDVDASIYAAFSRSGMLFSGLSQTCRGRLQFRVAPDQRSGRCALAAS